MPSQLRITILTDNAASQRYHSEWGLSVHVSYGTTSYVLDFGQSETFAQNARMLGIDLGTVDHAVLSHAHYDHADGMEAFFSLNDHAPLHLSATCSENCWSTKGGTTEAHYIGVRPGLLDAYADRLERAPVDHATTIAPGVHLVPHTTEGLARKGERDGMLLGDGVTLVPDDLSHEMSLVFELDGKRGPELVVLNSCSHAGVPVIVDEVSDALPGRRIAAFVGGLHLMRSSNTEILTTANVLRDVGVGTVWTGHCTGERALELLKRELPGRVRELGPGLRFSVGVATDPEEA